MGYGIPFWKLTLGVIATIGLYSILYRENKFYRLVEHIFLGLAAGWSVTAFWTETLYSVWWSKMTGSIPSGTAGEAGASVGQPGYWAYAFLLPLGLMGYFVFSKKHGWISRVPIGIILGLVVGQEVEAFRNRYMPQIYASMKPVIPNMGNGFMVPAEPIPNAVYPSQAIGNLVFLVTMLTVLSYFLFSFDLKSKFLKGTTTTGRWLLMIGFGAIFGNTVMTRFTLLIDRMWFIWIEWLREGVFQFIK
ncbi:MAG: hypothetical protein K1X67_12640 [Fimbriimonadaceae bacterium]|nr:hypothetical protein [Fimbriimonadaceae bacterium]